MTEYYFCWKIRRYFLNCWYIILACSVTLESREIFNRCTRTHSSTLTKNFASSACDFFKTWLTRQFLKKDSLRLSSITGIFQNPLIWQKANEIHLHNLLIPCHLLLLKYTSVSNKTSQMHGGSYAPCIPWTSSSNSNYLKLCMWQGVRNRKKCPESICHHWRCFDQRLPIDVDQRLPKRKNTCKK